jgi:predicted ATPase/DNA-binding CsgD family transcriptional regulator
LPAFNLVAARSHEGETIAMPRAAAPPEPLTSLVGRERDLARVLALLNDPVSRHVTLCGAGGIGKTRLALRLATDAAPDFTDGVALVELAPLTDPTLVSTRIAGALGIAPPERGEIIDAVIDHLESRNLLLILDNFEHLLPAAPLVPRLLAACPDLVVLATSRERLGTEGERVIQIEPLSLPDAGGDRDAAGRSEAVRLFVERAQASAADFVLSDANAADLIAVCRRLDGLPLAIELAAARVAEIPPRAVLANLNRVLPLLERGDGPARHRTMTNAILWSRQALSPDEQAFFHRLAVARGGFTLSAAAAIGAIDDETAVVTKLAGLIAKNLLMRRNWESDEPRCVMLETIREFGLQELAFSGQEADARAAHARFFAELAKTHQANLRGPDPGPALLALDAELDNFRAALAWLLENGPSGDLTAVALCNRLAHFWLWRGHAQEAKRWLHQAVEHGGETNRQELAIAQMQLGHLEQTNPAESRRRYLRSLELFHELGHERGVAGLLNCLGMNAEQMGAYDEANAYLTESLTLFERLDDPAGVAQCSYQLGALLGKTGDYPRAKELLAAARDLWEREGDIANTAFAIAELGRICRYEGRLEEASDLFEWSLLRLRQAGIRHGQGLLLTELGLVALSSTRLAAARQRFIDALAVLREVETFNPSFANSVEGLAEIALHQGEPALAIKLFAAVDAWRTLTGDRPGPVDQRAHDGSLKRARQSLGERDYAVAWNRGGLLTIAAAAELAETIGIAPAHVENVVPRRQLPGPEQLTRQEGRVLERIAAGLSNQQIADDLSVSLRTVTTHAQNIFGKLGVDNRTHAAAIGFHLGLIEPQALSR